MAKKKHMEPVLTHERKGSPYRHFDFIVDGERKFGSTKCLVEDVAGAEKVAAAIRNRLLDEAAARRVAPPSGPDAVDMTWNETVASYFEERGEFASYERDAKCMSWIGARIGDLSVRELDDDRLKALVAERRQEFRYGRTFRGKVGNGTVNLTVTSMVSKILGHAKSKGVPLLREPRYSKHRLPTKPREREMVIDEEMLLEAVRPDEWPFYQFVLATGLRKRSALIRKDQVHWRQGVIHVVGKGKKFQEVPITPEVAEILKAEWHKHPTHVFTYQARRTVRTHRSGYAFVAGEYVPLLYSTVNQRWRAICEKVGVTNLNIHDIRKTTGARIVRTTGDLKAASVVLGHADIKTTARHYSRITSADVRRRLAQTNEETRRLRAQWAPGLATGPDQPAG